MDTDYTLSSTVATSPDEIIVTFQEDNIAHEVPETVQLRFTLTTNNVPPGAILQDTLMFEIIDSDCKCALLII